MEQLKNAKKKHRKQMGKYRQRVGTTTRPTPSPLNAAYLN